MVGVRDSRSSNAKVGSRPLLALALVCLGAGCQQTNPAFDAPTTDELGEDGDSEEETERPPCPLEAGDGDPLDIHFDYPCGHNIPGDPEYYEYWMTVGEVSDSAVSGLICSLPGCEDCGGLEPTLEIDPIPLEGLVDAGECIQIRARQEPGSSECAYQTVAIWRDGEGPPVLYARAGGLSLPMIPGNDAWEDFSPGRVESQRCECEDFESPCCDAAVEPVVYAYQLGGGVTVEVGMSATTSIQGNEYEFMALDAFSAGAGASCEERLSYSWALVE